MDTLLLDLRRAIPLNPVVCGNVCSNSTQNCRMRCSGGPQHEEFAPNEPGRPFYGSLPHRVYYSDFTPRRRTDGYHERAYSERDILWHCRLANVVVRSVRYTIIFFGPQEFGPRSGGDEDSEQRIKSAHWRKGQLRGPSICSQHAFRSQQLHRREVRGRRYRVVAVNCVYEGIMVKAINERRIFDSQFPFAGFLSGTQPIVTPVPRCNLACERGSAH